MVKIKAPGSRTYDKEGFRLRAGCLCFRNEKEDEVLLVSSSGDPGRWVVPAGGIEPGEETITAAVREVKEEASVTGKIGRFLGIFQNDKAQSRTYVYVLFVTKVINEVNVDSKTQRWFPVNDAVAALKHRPIQQSYIKKALQSKRAWNEETQGLPHFHCL